MMYQVVIVGCGGMSRVWIDAILERDDAHIVALVDIFEENARKLADHYALDCAVFTDVSEAIDRTNANIVCDVTIPASHKEITLTALHKGCHVFGEKPMGTSLDEAQEMLQAARAGNGSYAVMQNRRYVKQIRAFRDIIAAGHIGEIGSIHADFFLGPHFGGFRETMESPLILDMAIHTFDQVRFITGLDPVNVYCHEFNPAGSWYEGNASAVAIFEMENGAVFCYRGSWCAEGAPTSWESEWRITGRTGSAIWDGKQAPYYEVVDPEGEHGFFRETKRVDVPLTYEGKERHAGCIDEMFAAIQEGRKAETDAADNIKSVAMVYAAIESAKTGKKVNIDV